MAVPPVVMIVPLFVLYTQLDLISTYQGAIIIYAGLITPFSVYLLTTFFRTLPKELFESARIDGAGDFLILWQIVLPLSLPALLTLVVVNALYVWNDLLIAIIFLQDDSKRTLMAGISVFQGRYNNQIPLTMAGMVIASAPMIILYIAFQKYFIRGLMAGAVKSNRARMRRLLGASDELRVTVNPQVGGTITAIDASRPRPVRAGQRAVGSGRCADRSRSARATRRIG